MALVLSRSISIEHSKGAGMQHFRGIILDVDGTLVDSNDEHAKAWVEAMGEYGFDVPFERVRPLIGMGSDKLLPEAIGVESESDMGKRIGERRSEIFKGRYLPSLEAFSGAHDLLERMHDEGLKLVVASSAKKDELDDLLKITGAADLIEEKTSGDDAEHTKPDPDIIHAALDQLGLPPGKVLMLGDTKYDVEAATRAGVATIALRCGGSSDEDLKGALAIYDDPADLLARYDESPLAAKRD
jgi:phosphoglycolate phosphatase-like HAD superfamily hydrolase